MKIVEVHFLHGFLGLPNDWDRVEAILSHELKGKGILVRFLKRNIWADIEKLHNSGPYRTQAYFSVWARGFEQELDESPHEKLLVGYSFGARLLMHLNFESMRSLIGALFIGGHPGLLTGAEKSERRMSDLLWSDSFLDKPWETLIEQWDGQSVFADDVSVEREEKSYNRSALARYFLHFSLSLQEPWTVNKNSKLPIHWAHGSNDGKFQKLVPRILESLPKSHIHAVEGGAHRLLFSHPDEIAKILLDEFLTETSGSKL